MRIYAERLLSGPLPWARMRQAYGLVRLCKKYGSERVEDVCRRSLAFDVVDVPRIERLLKTAFKAEEQAHAGGKLVPIHPPRFARDVAHFETLKTKTDGEKGGGQ